MNKAYANYLRDALDHYYVNDDEDEAIQCFLDFLEDYKPGEDAVEEPDAWAYAEADDFHPTIMVDEQTLQGFNIDRSKLTDEETGKLLENWAYYIGETAGDDESLDEQLDLAFDATGIDRKTVSTKEAK